MAVDLLNVGKTGLFTSKKAMHTAGHNIANVNTPGFSRQRTLQASKRATGEGNIMLGNGSYIKKVGRVHDEFLEKRMNQILSEKNYHSSRYLTLNSVEELLNEINTEGLNKSISSFFNSYRNLSNEPESETARSIIRENAKVLVRDIRSTYQQLTESAKGIDLQIRQSVNKINELLESLSKINVKILEMENIHSEAPDLRDKRDKIIREVSEHLEVHYFTDNKNRFTLNAKGIGTLVAGGVTNKLSYIPHDDGNAYPGSLSIHFEDRPQLKIDSKILQGKLQAYLDTKNKEIVNLKEKLDNLTWNLGQGINAIHRKGFFNGKVKDEKGKYTNIDFFKMPTEKFRSSEYIDISEDVKEDLNNIVSSLRANSPGDNRIALGISKLQHIRFLGEGTKTIEEDYLEGIGELAIASKKEFLDKDQSEALYNKIFSIKSKVSGVSIDEETTDLMKHQQAYNASAHLLKVAGEMVNQVLNIKG